MNVIQSLLVCGIILCQLQNVYSSPKVQINGNTIKGKLIKCEGKDVQQFLSIPYAQPPVGPLRFKKPQPVQSYPKKAFFHPPACPQYTDKPYPWYINSTHKSEDCLYLNIWTPGDASKSNKKAVLYWMHGGGFRFGSIRDELYNGIPLASLGDIIVVTVNYRLGVFGFLATETEDAPPNVGMHDMLEGLKWVNNNIEAFGGDVKSITIAGESAGAVTAADLTISPLSQRLYSRIILESGSSVVPLDGHGVNNVFGQNLAEIVGCANESVTFESNPGEVVECLRGVDNVTLTMADFMISPLTTNSFIPQYGGDFLPQNPVTATINGSFRCKDLFFGSNKNEGSFLFTSTFPEYYGFFGEKEYLINKTTAEETIKNLIKKVFPKIPVDLEKFLPYYFLNLTDNDHDALRHQAYVAMGDILILCPTVYYGEKCAEQTRNVYSYLFTHRPSVTPWAKWMGITHYEELQFVFGQPVLHPKKYQKSEVALSREMIRIWSNFVKEGKPDDLWPLFSKDNPAYKYLGPQTVTGKKGVGPHRDNCNFLRAAYG